MKITGSTSSGQIEFKQTHSANLDEGSAGDNGNDIVFQWATRTDRFIKPINGSKIAKWGSKFIGYYGCTNAPLTADRIHLELLKEGKHLCLLTNEGRYSEIRIDVFPEPIVGTLVISYTTWDFP